MQKTVLIVEDDEPTRLLLETLMARNGLATAVAHNGGEAIAMLDGSAPIDCMILDLMMPQIDGYDVLMHLAESGRDVPVIVCTAAVVGGAGPPFDERIVRAVVRKPFDIDQLTAIVNALTR